MAGELSAIVLIGADALIRDLGGDPELVITEAGLDPQTFDDPDSHVSLSAGVKFLELAANRLDCPDFGIRLSQRQDLSVLGPLYMMLLTSATLGDAIHMLAQYLRLHSTGLLISLSRVPEGLLLDYGVSFKLHVEDRQTVELGLALVVNFIRSRTRPDWVPVYAQFRHELPRDQWLHRRIFGADVAFGQDHNAICIDPETLAIQTQAPSSGAYKVALGVMRRRDRLEGNALLPRVEAAIRARLSNGHACLIDEVAANLGFSVRSLQRGLGEAETSFEDMRDSVRADLARKYLVQSNISLAEIAQMLGYAQPSALTRAFQRWYGTPPLRFRKASRAARSDIP